MIKDEEGRKWACQPCITGHRTGSCQHFDSPLRETRPPGRPTKGKANEPPVFWILTKIHRGGKCLGKPQHKVDINAIKKSASTPSASESSTNASPTPKACCSSRTPDAVMPVASSSEQPSLAPESKPTRQFIGVMNAGQHNGSHDHSSVQLTMIPNQTSWQWAFDPGSVDPTHSCSCGDSCECQFCLTHLNNEATQKAVQGMAQSFVTQNGPELFGGNNIGFGHATDMPAQNSTSTNGHTVHAVGQDQMSTSYFPFDVPLSPDPSYQQVAFPIMRHPNSVVDENKFDQFSLGAPNFGFSYEVGSPLIPASSGSQTVYGSLDPIDGKDTIGSPHFAGQNIPAPLDFQYVQNGSTIVPSSSHPGIISTGMPNGAAHSRGPSIESLHGSMPMDPNYSPQFMPQNSQRWSNGAGHITNGVQQSHHIQHQRHPSLQTSQNQFIPSFHQQSYSPTMATQPSNDFHFTA